MVRQRLPNVANYVAELYDSNLLANATSNATMVIMPVSISCRCQQCGNPLNAAADNTEVAPAKCPLCGSTVRLIEANIEARMSPYAANLRGKGREAPGRKPFVDFFTGSKWWWKASRWASRDWTADRRNDRWYEKVADPISGEIIHECDEPLSQHVGHGSAKGR